MKTVTKIALAAVLAAAGAAQAAEISFSDTNELMTTEIDQTLDLELFDSTLGTLTQVDISFGGEAVTTITLTSNAAQSQTVAATSTINFFLDPTSVGNLSITNPVFEIELGTGFQTIAPGAEQSFGPLDGDDSLEETFTTNLGAFQAVGGGDLDFQCTTLSGLGVVGGGGNVAAGQATQAACSASITYTYDETPPRVPAPASILLLGLGLAALGFRRK